jgi:hypothetical protein
LDFPSWGFSKDHPGDQAWFKPAFIHSIAAARKKFKP